jgi:hypothetical protein
MFKMFLKRGPLPKLQKNVTSNQKKEKRKVTPPTLFQQQKNKNYENKNYSKKSPSTAIVAVFFLSIE